jgi:AraC-like DNA-binding protein
MRDDSRWHSWDTARVRGDRISFWSDVVVRGVINSQMGRVTDGRFDGELWSRTAGAARFVKFRAGEHSIRRTASQTRGGDGHIMVGLQCCGEALMEQSDVRIRVEPGQIAILDSASPFSLVFPEHVERRLVLLPRAALASCLGRDGDLSVPRVLKGLSGNERVACELICRLTDTRSGLTDEACADTADLLTCVIARSLRPDSGNAGVKAEALARVKTCMHGNLADPATNPQSIAAAAGVSVRTLHRLFAEQGRTFSHALLTMRLDKARSAIVNNPTATLTKIALENGFADAAHFSKRFRQRFGEPPKITRSRARQ